MTPQEFCYWLQGFFEIADPKALDEKQTAMIKEHLDLVFTKVTGKEKPKKELITDSPSAAQKMIEDHFSKLRPGVTFCDSSSGRIC